MSQREFGQGGDISGDDSEYEVRLAKYSESTYSKVRPFIIIDTSAGHSICLPILTYGGRGILKPGVHLKGLAPAYSSGSKARHARDKGARETIWIRLTNSDERLDPKSLLNYAKIYTEHDVKIFPIGHVDNKSDDQLTADYNAVHPVIAPRGVAQADGNTFDR